jgi:hypothetical protein
MPRTTTNIRIDTALYERLQKQADRLTAVAVEATPVAGRVTATALAEMAIGAYLDKKKEATDA